MQVLRPYTWTSGRTWRLLPRREYTARDDYQLINPENRHTTTLQGWTHEQDNTKVIRTDNQKDTLLVRDSDFMNNNVLASMIFLLHECMEIRT